MKSLSKLLISSAILAVSSVSFAAVQGFVPIDLKFSSNGASSVTLTSTKTVVPSVLFTFSNLSSSLSNTSLNLTCDYDVTLGAAPPADFKFVNLSSGNVDMSSAQPKGNYEYAVNESGKGTLTISGVEGNSFIVNQNMNQAYAVHFSNFNNDGTVITLSNCTATPQ